MRDVGKTRAVDTIVRTEEGYSYKLSELRALVYRKLRGRVHTSKKTYTRKIKHKNNEGNA